LKMPEPVSVRDVQKKLLDAGTALVAYHLGAKNSYAWVIDKQKITVRKLADAATIDKLARTYHELLSRETPTDASAAGKRLAAAVWKPVQAKRIIIIADGALQYVPFG